MPAPQQSLECELVHDAAATLVARIDDLERWWRTGSADNAVHWEALAGKLHDLRPELVAAFQKTEASEKGRRQFDDLMSNHALLLADLDKVVMRLRVCEPGEDSWREAEEALTKLLSKLRTTLSASPAGL